MTPLSRLSGCFLILTLLLSHSAEGGVKRNPAVVREFRKLHPCPYAKTDCIADHVWPLCAGGKDAVSNLQWETRDESYRKDVWERRLCALTRGASK